MLLRNGKRKLDAYRPTFDPGLDVATLVFSHVQCVKTRHSLARVSRIWRDASKTAAAYPLRFDFGAFTHKDSWTPRGHLIIRLLDNDEALSLPYERVVGLLGEPGLTVWKDTVRTSWTKIVCSYAASRGSVRLLKWVRENNLDWSAGACSSAAWKGHLSVLQYLHENGCPWDSDTLGSAADEEHWNCFQYAVDNKCPGWKKYSKYWLYAEHLR